MMCMCINEFLGLKRSKNNTFIEKPRIKLLKNIDLLHELPFMMN